MAALVPDTEAKTLFYQLAVRLSEEIAANEYSFFISNICMEMEIYDFTVRMLERQIMEV